MLLTLRKVGSSDVFSTSRADDALGAPWGLARISHRKSLSFGTFNKYEYEHLGGEGVTAYIVDT